LILCQSSFVGWDDQRASRQPPPNNNGVFSVSCRVYGFLPGLRRYCELTQPTYAAKYSLPNGKTETIWENLSENTNLVIDFFH